MERPLRFEFGVVSYELDPDLLTTHNSQLALWLMRKPAHSDSEFFLVCQLFVSCACPHYVRSWLGELCRRDGFAVFHLNGGGIKGDRRRPPPEKPIDTESL